VKRFPIILGFFWILVAILLMITELPGKAQIEITWETESEINTAGFNLLRSESASGEYSQINETLIPAADDPIAGGKYEYIDYDVEVDKVYYYRLEDVEYDNTFERHEIIEAEAEGLSWWVVVVITVCLLFGIVLIIDARRMTGRFQNRSNANS
jgi:hypothetical protein